MRCSLTSKYIPEKNARVRLIDIGLSAQAVPEIRMAFCSVNFKATELIAPEMAQKSLPQAIANLRETKSHDCNRVALYLEHRTQKLTTAKSKRYQNLSDLKKHVTEEAISLTSRIIERKRSLEKNLPWKQKQDQKEMAGAYYFLVNRMKME